MKTFLELFRKWVIARKIPCAFIWSREIGSTSAEHLHLVFHLQPHLDGIFARQCVRWFGEEVAMNIKGQNVIRRQMSSGICHTLSLRSIRASRKAPC